MSVYAQGFVIAIILLFNIYVVNKLRNEQIEFKYAIIWLASGFIMLFFAVFPGILEKISRSLSIGLPVNLVFFMGIVINLIISFAITVTYSKLKGMVYRLTQANAILEREIARQKDAMASQTGVKPESSNQGAR